MSVRTNIDPSLWGRSGWNYIFEATLRLPVTMSHTEAADFSSLLGAFAYALPCASCREEFFQLLSQHPLLLPLGGGRDAAWEHVYGLYVAVNARMGKSTPSLSDLRSQSESQSPPFAAFFLAAAQGAPENLSDADRHAFGIIFGHQLPKSLRTREDLVRYISPIDDTTTTSTTIATTCGDNCVTKRTGDLASNIPVSDISIGIVVALFLTAGMIAAAIGILCSSNTTGQRRHRKSYRHSVRRLR